MPTRERCSLRVMTEADMPLVLEWRNSQRIRGFMFTDHVITPEEHARWWTAVRHDERIRLYIFELDDRAVGHVNLTGISVKDGTAEYGFYLGEEDVPRGCGSAMEFLALERAFGELDLRKVICDTLAFNTRALHMHEKFGFKREGVRERHVLKAGAFQDVVLGALFREDWEALREDLESIVFRP